MLNILSLQGNNRYFEGWNIVLASFRFFRGEYSSHHDYPPSHHYHQYMIKNHYYYIFSEIVPVLTLSYPKREGNTLYF